MKLEESTPEPKSWVYGCLESGGWRIHTLEGYSIDDSGTTACFERRKSDCPPLEIDEDELTDWFYKHEDLDKWQARTLLAKQLGVDLVLVIWDDSLEEINTFTVNVGADRWVQVDSLISFASCAEFADWLAELKGITVTKPFATGGRLADIDEWLREYGVPWPGNLDGFLVSRRREVLALFEFSRTRKMPVRYHDVNKYFRKDINRWKPLDILKKELDVFLYIILWSSSEDIVKLQKLSRITNGLHYEWQELLNSQGLISAFNREFGNP